jgi:hypothetical protein
MLLSPASFWRKVSRCFNHIDTRGVALRQLTEVRLNGAPAREVLSCPLPKISASEASKPDGVLSHVAGRWVKVPAEELGWSFTLGREGLSGLPHHQKPAPNGFAEGWLISPPSSMAAPITHVASRARSVCMGRQRTQRVCRVLPVPVTRQQCTTAGCSTHGKHLDCEREPGGKEKQEWGG